MQIKLKSLHLENFKGISILDIVFGDKTKIKGQNAAGKTTIFDAFTWLLFNKNSAGEEKFNVRPLDTDGNRIDNVEIKVVVTLDVDGNEVELSKVQKQNWVKKRGADTAVLQGNVNSFEIDGYPKSEADYKAYISGLVNEDLFKMLTNPQYFSNMKWKDQRDILMKFVSGISDVELAQERPEFAELIPELEKAPSTDDIQKKFSKALSEWKKQQAEIPVRIDELSKSLVNIDVAEQELAKNDLERKIAEVDEKLKSNSKVIDDLEQQKFDLQFEINDCKRRANESLIKQRRELEDKKYEATNKFNDLHSKISITERGIAEKKAKIATLEAEKADLAEQYKSKLKEEFAGTLDFDESEWIFDESSIICSLCGQPLPEDEIIRIKAEFETRKEKGKADAKQRLTDAKDSFEKLKESALNRITTLGTDKKDEIDRLKNEVADAEKNLPEYKNLEIEQMKIKNECESKLTELPNEVDLSANGEYVALMQKDADLGKQIAQVNSLGNDELKTQFEEEKKELQAKLDSVKAEIAKASKNVEIEERIGELETEQKEVSQKVADQEKMLYLLESFIRAKMLKISDSINQHFKTVNFKLFEMQLNGGMKECCECTVNGVPYSTLNSGHRIISGLDIIQSLSELYGVTVPIFIDNAESLNEFNVPDMAAQMILLSVSDDRELKVEVE